MKKIDVTYIEQVQKDKIERNKIASTVTKLMNVCNDLLDNFVELLKSMKVIEVSSIIWSMNRWINSKGNHNSKVFKIRDIVEVDLGIGYGFEMSYRHPCIILKDSNAGFCLVVPCSKGKYGKSNKFIIDGTTADGFAENTGVLIDAIRCISKTRITNKVGQITVPFLDKINNAILETYFPMKFYKLNKLEKDILNEKQKYSNLNAEHEKLRDSNKKLIEENEILKLKLDKIFAERIAKEGIKEEIESNKIS